MTSKPYPFYIKSTMILLGLVLLCYVFAVLREILVPLALGLMLAMLLNPLCNKLMQWKIPQAWAITISLVLAFIVIAGVGYFVVSQVTRFSDDLPALKERFHELTEQLQQTLRTDLGVDLKKQNQMIDEAEQGLKPFVSKTVGTVFGTLGAIFLIPIYTFLFMYYKTLILNFLYESFQENNSKEVQVILGETKGAIQNYMLGLLLESLAVAILNSAALLLLGVKYAILLGVIGALLNLLPYIGGLIGVAIPVIIATITKDGYQTQLFIIGAYLVIQFVDNHFLVPYIVSSKVRINALVSIVIVLLGGALWGVSGMFLSIPFVGVLKIIFDRVDELKPWGKLLGDEVPTRSKGGGLKLRRKKKS